MKILQINSAKNFGGGEKHFLDLTKGLRAHGHEIFVVVRPNAVWRKQLNFISNENILHLPLRNSLDLVSAWRLARIIKKAKIEVVHAHLARDYAVAALALRLSRTQTRLVLTRHVLFKINRFYKRLFPAETIFIAVSKAVQEELWQQNLVPRERVQLVLNGINTKHYEMTKESFNRHFFCHKFGLPAENLIVGIVGEITEHKGQIDFVKAAALLVKNWPHVSFTIIGSDSSKEKTQEKKLKKMIVDFDLSHQVRFLGWFDDAAPAFAAMNIFVSASHVEPFGLVIVEAMSAGCAIVATRTVGANEILEDNQTGQLVPIGDANTLARAIHNFLIDENKRSSFGRNAQIAAREKFDLQRMIVETEQVYRKF